MSNAQTLSPAQRANNFNRMTRANYHMLPSQSTDQLGTTLQFTLPKARLLSKTYLEVEASINVKTADTYKLANIIELSGDPFIPYKILRRVSLNLNNGYEPFVVSGRDLAIINTIRMNPEAVTSYMCTPKIDKWGYLPSGTINNSNTQDISFKFCLELENTLNQRDTSGLVLLQNESTSVNLSIDIVSNIMEMFSACENISDVNFNSIKVTPMIQTYTIPNYAEAYPNISIVKLTKARTETKMGAGEHITKLDVGTVYRKLALYITDENGNPIDDADITSPIELLYNTADTPIKITPSMLRFKNMSDFGYETPKGLYIFDFSGVAGLSGYAENSRDLVDTERLTEYWLKFSTSKTVKLTIVHEQLARLKA